MHKRMSSHGNEDHIGDSITLINNFKVKKSYLTVVSLTI